MKYYHVPSKIRNASKNDLIIMVMELLEKLEFSDEQLTLRNKMLHLLVNQLKIESISPISCNICKKGGETSCFESHCPNEDEILNYFMGKARQEV